MVLRNVATSFTIEQQRVEINELAGDVDDILTGTTTVPGSFNALAADVAGEAAALSAGATGADLTLSGNLTVNGTQTILNTETLEVEDKNIVLCKDGITDAAANGGGITLYGNSAKTLLYLASGDKWISNIAFEIESHLEVAGTCTATLFDGNGTNLTDLPAGQLTGALPAIDGSALTGIAAGGATIADAGNANANSTILFSANASGSNQTLSTDGGLLYNAAEDALKVNGTIITAGGITGAGSSCVIAAANHSSTCSITVGSTITIAGEISDSKGKLRSIPQNYQASAYTLVASDAGKHILADGNITWTDNTFAAGDAVTIINATGGDITITKGNTMFFAGDGSNDNRTLSTKGMATILWTSGTASYISGAGLS